MSQVPLSTKLLAPAKAAPPALLRGATTGGKATMFLEQFMELGVL